GRCAARLPAAAAACRPAAGPLPTFWPVPFPRHILAPRQPTRRRYGALPRAKLRAVVEYVEEHLDASPTLERMAAIARLSPFYFASQFNRATGLPPHQYVIARRVERAQQLPQDDGDVTLPAAAR